MIIWTFLRGFGKLSSKKVFKILSKPKGPWDYEESTFRFIDELQCSISSWSRSDKYRQLFPFHSIKLVVLVWDFIQICNLQLYSELSRKENNKNLCYSNFSMQLMGFPENKPILWNLNSPSQQVEGQKTYTSCPFMTGIWLSIRIISKEAPPRWR